MPLTYSCVISHPYDVGDAVIEFVALLETQLINRGAPVLDLIPYTAKERLAGLKVEAGIARALCESVCMIAVYMPTYERRAFCLREFAAMEAYEEERRKVLKDRMRQDQSMTLTIVYRHRESNGNRMVPSWIRNQSYFDFSNYAMAGKSVFRNPKSIDALETIVRRMSDVKEVLVSSADDPCPPRTNYSLPAADSKAVKERLAASPPWQGQPLRRFDP
jgi:hypothetical protein